MSDQLHRRLGGHLRRHSIAYAVLALAVSISPAPSMAADLVTTADIANGAVTTTKLAADSVVSGKIANETVTGADLKNGTVGNADLADSAKGAKVIRYALGDHDFGTNPSMSVQLPGSWTKAAVTGSSWSATMYVDFFSNAWAVPGLGPNAATNYRLAVSSGGNLVIDRATGPGEGFENIYVFRTVATSTESVS